MPGAPYRIGLSTLVLLTSAGVFSVVNTASLATDGLALVTYLLLGSLLFLVPTALVAAELGSRVNKDGGVFAWVDEAFGPRLGAVAQFAQWASNLPFLPYLFAFMGSALAYIFHPPLAESRWWIFANILAWIWLTTLANFGGVRNSSRFTTVTFVVGNLLPAAVLVGLAAWWLARGMPSGVPWNPRSLLPDRSLDQLMILAAVMLSLMGVDVTAPLVRHVDRPERTFPRGVLITAVLVTILYVASSLSVAVLLPSGENALVAGTLMAFQRGFGALGVPWVAKLLAAALCIGALSVGVVWTLSTARAMMAMARLQLIPEVFGRTNARDVPTGALLVQAVLASLLALPVLFLPTVGSAFFLSLSVTTQMRLVLYMMEFATFLRLKRRDRPSPTAYTVPGGIVGAWIVGGIGTLSCLVGIGAGFVPSAAVRAAGFDATLRYWAFIVGTMFVLLVLPLAYIERRRRGSS